MQNLATATAAHIEHVKELDLELREEHRAKHGKKPTWDPLIYPHTDASTGWNGPITSVAATAVARTPSDVNQPVLDALLTARIIIRLLGHWAAIEDQRKNRKHLRDGDPSPGPVLPPATWPTA